MKKILMIQNDSSFSNNTFEFVKKLSVAETVNITYFSIPKGSTNHSDNPSNNINDVRNFKRACKNNKIGCKTISEKQEQYLPSLIRETTHNDLLLISKKMLTHILNNGVEDQLLVHNAKCPILVIPDQHYIVDNIILAYDGKLSTAYAIKQFPQLFPTYCQLPTLLAYADYKERDIPYQQLIEKLAARHFPDLAISKADMVPERFIITWLMNKPNSLLVIGTFEQIAFSELFRKSFIWNLINECEMPIFIAH